MSSNISKKRKASEIDAHPPTNGHVKVPKTKKSAKGKAVPQEEVPEPPFKVICPYKGQADYTPGIESVRLGPNFTWDYGIRSFGSGPRWEDIKAYKNVKLNDMAVTVGDTVYVLHNPKAKELSPDATDEEILAYDKKNCWVGKILQARAANDREVYILVAWLYWPNEIPKDVKKNPHYYGEEYATNELIMSNWLDVIDANSISARADVYYLDENNEKDLQNVPDRFWRQTFDAGQAVENPTYPKMLSGLKKFCKCQRPINPSTKVLHCAKGKCKAWNHERCIVDEIGDDLWPSYEDGTMDKYAKQHSVTAKSLGSTLVSVVGTAGQEVKEHLGNLMEDGIAAVAQEATPQLKKSKANVKGDESTLAITSPKSGKKGRSKQAVSGAWSKLLSITIIFDNNHPPVARVTEKDGKKNSWDLRVDCLVCGKTMD